jgi:hypothetical protein
VCVYNLFLFFIFFIVCKYVVGYGEPLVDAQATAAAQAQLPSATIAMSRPPPLLPPPPASARVRALGSLAGRTVERRENRVK